MVSVNGGVAGATYSYNWTNTANFGAMADANGHSGPSFTSLLAAVTYVPKGSDGTDTVSVEVFVVAADKTLHRLGTEHCTVSVRVGSLIFTPSDTTLAVSQSQVFTVAPVTGSFPSGSSFVWELVGKGSINGSRNVTTAAPQVTFKAPSVIGAASLDLTVKNSKGATIATGGILITIVQVALSPNSVTFNGPGQTSSFSVNGRFPSGTTYMWSCTSGGLSTTGTSTPFPKTLTTSTPRVTYFVANPPADGSPATDTLSVTVSGPTGTSLGSESATILYGGTPFFTATYPNKNNEIVTGVVSGPEMTNLNSDSTSNLQAYSIRDRDGFLYVLIGTVSGGTLAAGQSFTLDEPGPITQPGEFLLAGSLGTKTPRLESGSLQINSVIPDPGVNGNFIGFSINIQCEGGQSIVANGVVLQHF
jgi:hypothetical protein